MQENQPNREGGLPQFEWGPDRPIIFEDDDDNSVLAKDNLDVASVHKDDTLHDEEAGDDETEAPIHHHTVEDVREHENNANQEEDFHQSEDNAQEEGEQIAAGIVDTTHNNHNTPHDNNNDNDEGATQHNYELRGNRQRSYDHRLATQMNRDHDSKTYTSGNVSLFQKGLQEVRNSPTQAVKTLTVSNVGQFNQMGDGG